MDTMMMTTMTEDIKNMIRVNKLNGYGGQMHYTWP